jgi:hypothetical protein
LYSISLKLRIRDQRDDPLVQMLTNRMEVPSVVIDELTHFLHETCQLVNKTRTFILRQKKMKGENTKARACLDYIVDFRSAVWLPYEHWSVANTDTRSAPNILGRACFFFPYGA